MVSERFQVYSETLLRNSRRQREKKVEGAEHDCITYGGQVVADRAVHAWRTEDRARATLRTLVCGVAARAADVADVEDRTRARAVRGVDLAADEALHVRALARRVALLCAAHDCEKSATKELKEEGGSCYGEGERREEDVPPQRAQLCVRSVSL